MYSIESTNRNRNYSTLDFNMYITSIIVVVHIIQMLFFFNSEMNLVNELYILIKGTRVII